MCEVRFTLNMIVWRREPNRGRQRQIRISSNPLEIDENCYTDPILDVDSDGEVRFYPTYDSLASGAK